MSSKLDTTVRDLWLVAHLSVQAADRAIATAKAAYKVRHRGFWEEENFQAADLAAREAIQQANLAVELHRKAEALERAAPLK